MFFLGFIIGLIVGSFAGVLVAHCFYVIGKAQAAQDRMIEEEYMDNPINWMEILSNEK